MKNSILNLSTQRPVLVYWLTLLFVALLGSQIVRIQIDTDPENMLADDAPVRVANAELRELFGSNQLLVVGLFSDGPVTDAATLDAAAALHDELARVDGVDAATMISVRSAMQGELAPGASTADWAAAVVDAIAVDPLLAGNVLSADGDTLAFFVPLVLFWLAGCIPRWLTPHLIVLFILGGLQGALGWYMVSSGLVDRVDVSQ